MIADNRHSMDDNQSTTCACDDDVRVYPGWWVVAGIFAILFAFVAVALFLALRMGQS